MKKLLCAVAVCSLVVSSKVDALGQGRVITQESARIQAAKKKNRWWIFNKLFDSKRQNALFERTAAIAAWQERVEQAYERDASFGRYAHLFTAPAWPQDLQFGYEPDSLDVGYTVSRANRGCLADGTVVDVAQLALGAQTKIKDVLVASALSMQDGVAQAVGYEFLQDLAQTNLDFSGSQIQRSVVLSYAHSMVNNTVRCGFSLPFVEQVRNVRVWPYVSDGIREKLSDRETVDDTDVPRNDVFRDLYGINVATFFQDVIERKGMRYDEHISQFGVGDATVFVTASVFPQGIARMQVGVSLELPFARDADHTFFYPLHVGNGGFVAARGSVGVLAEKRAWGQLHGMASYKASFPATVMRRVPRQIMLSDVSSLPSSEVFGEQTTFAEPRTVALPETVIPHFAQQTQEITLRPGFEIDLRLGNVVMQALFRALQCDMYYNFHLRTTDQVKKNIPVDQWYTAPFVSGSYRVQHSLGMHLTYQPNKHFSLKAGLVGVVLARELPLTWTGMTALSYSW